MDYTKTQLEALLEYATPIQTIALKAVIEYGTIAAAAKSLSRNASSVSRALSAVSRAAAACGYAPEAGLVRKSAEGFGLLKYHVMSVIDKETGEEVERVKNYSYDRTKEELANSIIGAINEIIENMPSIPEIKQLNATKYNLMNNYISNDLHFGALHWSKETGDKDYDLKEADLLIRNAIDYLVETSTPSKYAVISDLGDMLEIDDFKSVTPKSGNHLDTDGRYSKILTIAIDAMIYMVMKALQFHEKVYFLNIAGNHDVSTAHAIREVIRVAFRDNPRVIVDTSPRSQKYLKYGKSLIGYAHGDGLRMSDADGTMTVDCIEHISNSVYREMHFGHNHKDKIYEGKVCKSESHRNMPSLNGWASHAGFRRQLGTMKCITYCPINGRKGTNIFNIEMDLETVSDAVPTLLQ